MSTELSARLRREATSQVPFGCRAARLLRLPCTIPGNLLSAAPRFPTRRKQARVKAVQDAADIAATLAEAAGVALGAIASIADSNVAPAAHEFAGPGALRLACGRALLLRHAAHFSKGLR